MSEPKEKQKAKPAYSYFEHSAEEIEKALQAGVPLSGVFHHWLTERCLETVSGQNEFERGICEGRRQLAGQILWVARGE